MTTAAVPALILAAAFVLLVGLGRSVSVALILAPAVGFGALSLVYFASRFLLGASGHSFAPVGWMLLVAVGSFGVARLRPRIPGALPRLRRPASLSVLITTCSVLTVVLLAGWLLTRRHPLGQFDAWAIWSSRARQLYLSEDLTTTFSNLHAPHPDYPLFLPATLAAQFAMYGGPAPGIPIWTGAVFLFAAAGAVALGVRRLRAAREWATAAPLLLLATPQMTFWGFAQCADVPLSYFLTLSVIGLATLSGESDESTFGAATTGFLVGSLAWTKNEGMILSVLLLGLFGVRMLRGSRARGRLLKVGAAAAVPWSATLLFKLGWGPHTDLPVLFSAPLSNALSIERWRFVAASFWERLDPVSGFGDWGFVWVLCGAALSIGLLGRAWRERPIAFLLVVVTCCWLLWFAIFLATPMDVEWHVRTALSRLMLQLLPLTLVTALAALAAAFRSFRGPPNGLVGFVRSGLVRG